MSKLHYRWIPTTYFMQGMPFAIVMSLTSIFYKELKIDNVTIAFYTSILILPWSLKPLITPFLENLAPKRKLTILAQASVGFTLVLIVIALFYKNFFYISTIIFFLLACIGSIHDICSDGTYLLNLTEKDQADFVGVRIIFYQVARFVVASGLVVFVGCLEHYYSITTAWQFVLMLAAILALCLAIFNWFMIPTHRNDKTLTVSLYKNFVPVFQEIFKTPNLFLTALFIFIYNMPEIQLIKIVPLYLLDHKSHGGLALSNIHLGTIYGGFGIVAVMIGASLSGKIVARYGIKKTLLPLTFFTVCSNAFYLLFYFQILHQLWLITIVLCITQFGFGISNGAYMTYLLYQANGRPYQMSLYAYSTAIMAFGMSVGGSFSGLLQQFLGYHTFFLWILVFGAIILLLTYITVNKTLYESKSV